MKNQIIDKIRQWLKKETKGLNIVEDTKHSPIFSYNDILELIRELEDEKRKNNSGND